MMPPPATATVLVITVIASMIAFRDSSMLERWLFKPREILAGHEYERLITSGLIHADWRHLIFNAFSLYSFAQVIELLYGMSTLLLIYLSAILGGGLLSLWVHRHHDYRALGASGGVCGVIFSYIFLFPGGAITFPFIPIPIPAFAYAVGFLVISFIRMRGGKDCIGHDAHLGGAMIGVLVATLLYPRLVFSQPLMFGVVVALCGLILAAVFYDPLQLFERRTELKEQLEGDERSRRYQSNRQRNQKMEEIDRLLEKVGARGLHSLSKSEREQLDKYSQELRGERTR